MNKMSKRVLARVLAVVLAALMVFSAVGCSSKATDTNGGEKPATTKAANGNEGSAAAGDADQDEEIKAEPGAKLKVWINEGTEKKWMEGVAKDFTAKYNIPVVIEPVSHSDSPKKIQTDGPAKQGADVFEMNHDNIPTVCNSGLVLPNELDFSQFIDVAGTALKYQDQTYGYPTVVETYALLYNKALVKELPKTFDDLINFCKTFNDVKKEKYGFMFEPSTFYYTHAFFAGFGGYVFGNNGSDPKDIGINNEGAVKGIEYYQKLKEILPLKIQDLTYDIKKGLFAQGKLAFNLSLMEGVKDARDNKIEVGAMPLPVLPNGEHPKSFAGVRGLYINSYTQYPEASKLFAMFATSKEMIKRRFAETGQIPVYKELMNDSAVVNDELAKAFLEQASYAIPMPNIPEMISVWQVMNPALEPIWNKGANVKATLDDARKKLDQLIAANK
ncbi:MAG: maltose ABC transporter substrate-binding protein [Clostridia bacterium]|nr:maltose ABC transporter substrate-binding protein [Clostridia bacterium]